MHSTSFIRISVALGCALIAACTMSPNTDLDSTMQAAVPPSAAREQALDEALAGLVFSDDGVAIDASRAGDAGHLSDAELQALVDEAESQLARGRGIRAAAAFTEAIISAPDRASLYDGLARALTREGRTRQALSSLRTALTLAPDRLEIRFALGNALNRLGRLDEAMEVWRRVIELDPDFGDAHGRLAVGYYLLGLPELAAHHQARAVALDGAVPAQLATMIATGHPPSITVYRGAPAGATESDAEVIVGAQVRINNGGGTGPANETAAVAIDAQPGVAIAAWNSHEGAGYRVGVGVTQDYGQTWTDWEVTANNSFCDAMAAGDPRTGTLWLGGLDQNMGIFVSRKIDGTAGFEPAKYAGAADKPWMAAGPRPGEPDSTRLYVTANIHFAHSDDLGNTWTHPSSVNMMSGIGHLPRVGPEGELYIAYWDLGYGVKLQRSFDGGATLSAPITIATRLALWDIYDAPMIPGDFRVPPLSYLAVDQNDGTLYCVYWDVTGQIGANDNVDLYFTSSTDQGSTWATPAALAFDPTIINHGDQFFSWLEVDSSGRLHLLFLDTRNTVQNDSAPSASLDAYYAWSDDGGLSWTEHRLTPTPYNTGAVSGFIGDYMGMGVGHNHVYPVYPQVSSGVNQIMSNPIEWVVNPLIFEDGFETGDTTVWSETTG